MKIKHILMTWLLLLAIKLNWYGLAKVAITLGAPLNHLNARGLYSLHFAIMGGNPRILNLLLQSGADPNLRGLELLFPPLACIAMDGSVALAEELVSAGANIEGRIPYVDQTPLIVAARFGNIPMVVYLLTHGARIDHQDFQGATALATAAFYGQCEVARLLLEHGADVQLEGINGSPVHIAKLRAHDDVLQLLRTHIVKRFYPELAAKKRDEREW